MSALDEAAKRWGTVRVIEGTDDPLPVPTGLAGLTSQPCVTGTTVSSFITTAAWWPYTHPNWKGSA